MSKVLKQEWDDIFAAVNTAIRFEVWMCIWKCTPLKIWDRARVGVHSQILVGYLNEMDSIWRDAFKEG